VLVIAAHVVRVGFRGDARAGPREQLGAYGARVEQVEMPEDRAVECGEVVLRDGVDFLLHERMAADRALAVDHHRAREDVRAFDGDADRHRVPRARERVARAALDRAAGADVHRVADDLAHAVGEVGLADVADDGGLFACVERAAGERARGGHEVGEAGDARERFLDAFEAADRRVELLAHGRVRTADPRAQLRGADRQRRQRDRAARGERFHKHAPAVADLRAAADDGVVERHEHVLADDRAVLERHAHRVVAQADLDAGCRTRDQRAGDTAILDVADELVWIFQSEREADQRRHRCERDVALLPVQAQAEHFHTVDDALLDDAFRLRRGCVGASFRAGQCEARNFFAAREAVEMFFFCSSVP
jgi:hypothetical protein